jgi:hypothetical protein
MGKELTIKEIKMKIDEAIDMLNQARDNGSKDVIFAFWEAKEFKRKENKTNFFSIFI